MRLGRAPLWMIAIAVSGCGPTQERGVPARTESVGAAIITGNGLRSDAVSGDETVAQCATFRLTSAQVLNFFAQARTVDDRTYQHDADMSRCYAKGTIRLPGGEDGTWTIDQARRGQFVRADGTHRYLICTACAAPPFLENDDEADD